MCVCVCVIPLLTSIHLFFWEGGELHVLLKSAMIVARSRWLILCLVSVCAHLLWLAIQSNYAGVKVEGGAARASAPQRNVAYAQLDLSSNTKFKIPQLRFVFMSVCVHVWVGGGKA